MSERLNYNNSRERIQYPHRVFVIGRGLIYPYRSNPDELILQPHELTRVIYNNGDSLVDFLPTSRRDESMPNEGIVLGSFFNPDGFPEAKRPKDGLHARMTEFFRSLTPDLGYNNKYNPSKHLRSPEEAIAVAGAMRALKDANIRAEMFDESIPWLPKGEINTRPLRVAVGVPNSLGPIEILGEAALKGLTKEMKIKLALGGLSGFSQTAILQRLNATGPTINYQHACSTGLGTIHEGSMRLKTDQADLAIVGGFELGTQLIWAYTLSQMEVTPSLERYLNNPQDASQPGDRNLQGLTLLEGISVVVLATGETMNRLHIPEDKILAEITGSALGHDPVRLIPPDPPRDAVRTIYETIFNAGLTPEDIDFAMMHFSGTKPGDIHDYKTLRIVYDLPDRNFDDPSDVTVYENVPLLTSPKSYTGHNMSGSGPLTFFSAIDALRKQEIPGTRNITEPHGLVFNQAMENKTIKAKAGLVQAVGMDGTISTVAVSKI